MKKIIALFLFLCFALSACVLAEEIPPVTTIGAWLDSNGTGNGLITVRVKEVLNPVLAVVEDETGSVNLFGVTIDAEMVDFFTAGIEAGDILVLWKPVYNLYEDTVEMADAVLLKHIPAAMLSTSSRTEADEYEYTASEEEELHIYDRIFLGDVLVHGVGQPVFFHNCEFCADLICDSPSGTYVWVMADCTFGEGARCILKSGVREADMEYAIPKFALCVPAEVECEDLGGVLAAGVFDQVFNGTVYQCNEVEYYQNESGEIVPYEDGMEIHGYVVMHWWENGEEIVFTLGAF